MSELIVTVGAFASFFLVWHAGRRAGIVHERNKEYRDLVAGTWSPTKESK